VSGHTHKRACTHTHTHTHIQICNTYCFSTAKIIRERASVLRYTYIACLDLNVFFLASFHEILPSFSLLLLLFCYLFKSSPFHTGTCKTYFCYFDLLEETFQVLLLLRSLSMYGRRRRVSDIFKYGSANGNTEMVLPGTRHNMTQGTQHMMKRQY
jgi:hypothetical protein